MMHFDVFVETIGALLDVEISADLSRPESGLFDDWGLDSLQAFQLIVAIEAVSGSTQLAPIPFN